MATKQGVLIIAAVILLVSAVTHAKTEHHQLTSSILKDAGEQAERGLSVYVPDVASISDEGYPVLYLFHGYTGTNETFLGGGYPDFGELEGEIYIDQVVTELIESGEIEPMIVVFPHVKRANPLYDVYTPYVTEEIIPFVEANYPAIPKREARAIAGHSIGGSDAIQIALRRSDLFNLVGAYSPYFLYPVDETMFGAYDKSQYPLKFWLYAGENDDFNKIPPETHAMVDLLNVQGLPCTSTFDDSDHWDMIGARIRESIVFFSRYLSSSSTAVTPRSWGYLKNTR